MISILEVAIGRNVSVFAANDDLSLLSKKIFGLADSTFKQRYVNHTYLKKVDAFGFAIFSLFNTRLIIIIML